jgi:hypothetical protein
LRNSLIQKAGEFRSAHVGGDAEKLNQLFPVRMSALVAALHRSKSGPLMSALGHKQTNRPRVAVRWLRQTLFQKGRLAYMRCGAKEDLRSAANWQGWHR